MTGPGLLAQLDDWLREYHAEPAVDDERLDDFGEIADAVKLLTACRAALQSQPVWHPIDSAPRHTELYFRVVPKTADETYRDTSGNPIVSTCPPHLHHGRFGTWSSLQKATHWMKLPDLPIVDAEAARVPAPAEPQDELVKELTIDTLPRYNLAQIEAGFYEDTEWLRPDDVAKLLAQLHAEAQEKAIADLDALKLYRVRVHYDDPPSDLELVKREDVAKLIAQLHADAEAALRQKIAEVEAQGRAARAALREYGQHHVDCGGWRTSGLWEKPRAMHAEHCTCGLTAALADLRPRE